MSDQLPSTFLHSLKHPKSLFPPHMHRGEGGGVVRPASQGATHLTVAVKTLSCSVWQQAKFLNLQGSR